MRRLALALCLLVPRAEGQARVGPTPEATLSFQAQLPTPEAWRDLIQRDRRVTFSSRTLALARERLAAENVPEEERAAAWLALGAAGGVDQRPRLEETARGTEGVEPLAAALALGELDGGSQALLLELAQSPRPEVWSCALLALLRLDRPALRRGIEEIAHDSRDPRAGAAGELLVFAFDPEHSVPSPAARLLLELRWLAAREFGLIDGQAWRVLVFRGLCERADFVREVVLRAAARLERPGIRDQLLGALLAGSGEGSLRAAARGMPRELAGLVENGLYQPPTVNAWRVIFDELEASGVEAYVPELYQAALEQPELRYRAIQLLGRTGLAELGALLESDLSRLSPADRVLACRAMGESANPSWTKRLAPLAEAAEPAVRAAALVAGLRLGSRKSELGLKTALDDATNALRPALLVELLANARDTAVGLLLEEEFEKASGEPKNRIAQALAREGHRGARQWCRELLLGHPPPPPARARELVAALRQHLSSEDLELLTQLFPREPGAATLALNVELALALAELGHASAQPVLHAALWRGEFEVSLLAGALLAQASGMHALREEAANPPADASSPDLRRVGYALGLWGGFPEVEALAQRLRYNSGAPALQGVLLGFLSTRTQ